MAIPAQPTIAQLPPAPQRTDTPTEFADKADVFVAALDPYRQQLVAGIDWQNTVFTETEAVYNATVTARDDAQGAESGAVDAKNGAQAAEAGANDAKDTAESAAAAAQSSAGLPSLTGNAGLPLVVAEDEAGVAYSGSLRRYDLASVASSATLDLAQSNVFRVDASTARTLSLTNAPGANRAMTVVVHITGNAGVTWPNGIAWDEGYAPPLGDSFTRVLLIWDGVEWTGSLGAAR